MSEYSLDDLFGKLERADAAGDREAATVIADEIRRMQGAPAKPDFSNVTSGATTNPATAPQPERKAGQGMGLYRRYMAGVGRSIDSTYRGAKLLGTELLAHGLADSTGLTGTSQMESLVTGKPAGSNSASEYFRRSAEKQRQDFDVRRAQDDEAFDGDYVAGFGNVVGTLAQILGPGAALRGTTAGAAFMPSTIGGNIAQGAAIGALQPVGTQDNRLANIALGGAAGGVGSALPIAGGGLLRLAQGATGGATLRGAERRAGELIRAEATNAVALATPQPSAIPGVQRTLAEETLDPGIARLERQMRGQANTFDPIDRANNAARVAQLERIAGTDADMGTAIAARRSSTKSARDQAMAAGDVDITQTIAALDDAIKGQQGRPAVQAGLRQVRSLLVKETEAAPGLVTTTNESSVPVLDNVRKTIGDMLSGKYGGENAAALQGSRELIGVRDKLTDEVSGQVPAFADYLDAYRRASKPINRMEVGRALSGSSSGSAVLDPQTGAQVLLPASFSKAARDIDSVAAKATGFAKAKATDILTKEDIATIRAIQDDLQRQSFRATAGSGGNSMTQERQALQDRIGRRIASRIPGIGGFVDAIDQIGNQRVNERLAYLLANPAEARRVVAALPPQDRAVVNKALLQLFARPAAASSALTND